MSISRNLFNEIRPFFRLFDEISRATPVSPLYPLVNRPFGRQFEPFLQSRHPSIDISEQGNDYIVEAEVPGVKKENLNVRVGDGGQSITVEGQIYARSSSESDSPDVPPSAESTGDETDSPTANKVTKDISDPLTQLSAEREFSGSAHFLRTVWLPRPVDGSKIAAKLSDGILTLRIPKAEEKDSVKVEIQ